MADANHRPLGSVETCNKRTINQFIHPDVLKTCQLSMGMTELEPGSNWNTMPSHTHERRMEIYTYFELPDGQHRYHRPALKAPFKALYQGKLGTGLFSKTTCEHERRT